LERRDDEDGTKAKQSKAKYRLFLTHVLAVSTGYKTAVPTAPAMPPAKATRRLYESVVVVVVAAGASKVVVGDAAAAAAAAAPPRLDK
jgi:hypothetical protein